MCLANVFQPFLPHCCGPTVKNTFHGHLGVSLLSVSTPANKRDCFGKVYSSGFVLLCFLICLGFF